MKRLVEKKHKKVTDYDEAASNKLESTFSKRSANFVNVSNVAVVENIVELAEVDAVMANISGSIKKEPDMKKNLKICLGTTVEDISLYMIRTPN